MAKLSTFVKAATPIVATTVTLLTTLKENPQLAQGIDSAIEKLKKATNSENPRLRFEAKVKAIDVAADAVAEVFPFALEPEGWRRQAQALRMRGELAWNSNTGGRRRKAMKALTAETEELLADVNSRLISLQAEAAPQALAD